ncbi:MAG: hypothetical protein QM762_24195 [Chryseolinea sp.]
MRISFITFFNLSIWLAGFAQPAVQDLSGSWDFQLDREDIGIAQKWYSRKFDDKVELPGSLATNGKGDDVSLSTPWTGSILDSTYFWKPEYAPFREAGNIKVPFWLQPNKYYKGVAWFQKRITIPKGQESASWDLFIERAHWETTVWIDNEPMGAENSLGTPHVHKIGSPKAGEHTLTIRVDNRVKEINVGQNSHSISDHTQTNWNGMIGRLELRPRPPVHIDLVKIFPDVSSHKVVAQVKVTNNLPQSFESVVELTAFSSEVRLPVTKKKFTVKGSSSSTTELEYDMGSNVSLWSEFDPKVYKMSIKVSTDNHSDSREVTFGMREFSRSGTQFTVNGTPIFLRGTLECAIFPKTGFPPTDIKEWTRIFTVVKSFGLNHVRFHSWCPLEAAFDAADNLGVYLQIESSSWANWGTELGAGFPIDDFIYKESNSIVDAFGNHPSFCLLAYGNEPGGKNHVEYLTKFVTYWKNKDSRRQYTTAAGWPAVAVNDYNNIPEPRIQHWGAGLKSIINSKSPSFDYDWSNVIQSASIPTVSHEIGQWCVYPDFKEIKQYTGVLQAKNFEIFQNTLARNGMAHLADSFLLASGKLQVLCYKADIEAALRTKNFGGFQLLDLHDFPGQGSAIVGVLSPFWTEKGYVTGAEYSQFSNAVVPLARFRKMIYLNNETLVVPVEVANFSGRPIAGESATWTITDCFNKELFRGSFRTSTLGVGNGVQLGTIEQALEQVAKESKLTVTVALGRYKNSWDIFVYPAQLPAKDKDIIVTDHLDAVTTKKLMDGGKVLLSLRKGTLKPNHGGSIAVGFSSIFWNTAWTNGQPPHTLGILCNPHHPALSKFPTQFHSNWQWWDGMAHGQVIILDSIDKNIKPIVRVIDDWVTARPLGLVMECSVGKGKLIISGIDLVTNVEQRPEARQLLYSLTDYMRSEKFQPVVSVPVKRITDLTQ